MIFSHIVQERLGQVILWAGTPSTGCYLLSEVFWQDPVNQYFSRQRNRWEKWQSYCWTFSQECCHSTAEATASLGPEWWESAARSTRPHILDSNAAPPKAPTTK